MLKASSTLWVSALFKTVWKYRLKPLINSENAKENMVLKILSFSIADSMSFDTTGLSSCPTDVPVCSLWVFARAELWAHQEYKNTGENLEFLQFSTSYQCISTRALSHGNDPFKNYYPIHGTQSLQKSSVVKNWRLVDPSTATRMYEVELRSHKPSQLKLLTQRLFTPTDTIKTDAIRWRVHMGGKNPSYSQQSPTLDVPYTHGWDCPHYFWNTCH